MQNTLFFFSGGGGDKSASGVVIRGERLFECVVLLSRVLLKTVAIEKTGLIKILHTELGLKTI